jgi:hypothetical protein
MQNNTAFSLLFQLIRSKTKCTRDLQKGLLIRDLMTLDKSLTVEDVARRVRLSLPWVVIRKSLADAFVHGDPILREAIVSGRIPTASAFYEFQLLEDDTRARLLKSDLPELSSRVCRQAKTLQGSPMSDADFIKCLSERGSGEDWDQKHLVERFQTREETLALELPKRRNKVLVEFDAAVVQDFLKVFGRPVPVSDDRLEVTRSFVEVVKQIAAASRQGQ